ncbi:acyl-coenzyme A diphosphatase NUDT19 [Anolis carolinensis]|uniref:Acyl-coenzyme A diphosphatase NUDT19 n=1 Tax=Anolis carolinensis TaxID=28377 RepID=H9GCN3_ANOCA|nr:PREDICTED: nucleoside diphosphate-linked moiety X motif 19 [Anolis carolinensis]|eukprot:XP_003227455.1 PREDICTED: nucleoside diphosphate-linked moiety X motif 19 [Anolis carolinensis]
MAPRSRPWREAATVLLAAGGGAGGASPRGCDYRVLLLRRSPRSAFMPSAHVFPGGVADAADFSPEWWTVLPGPAPLCGLRPKRGPRAPLFAAERPELGQALPGDLAFRLCAIRETFEEAGLLLLAEPDQAQAAIEAFSSSEGPAPCVLPPERLPLPGPELAEWRRRVQRQPSLFLALCRRLGLVPNIWALSEWSNWLTPRALAGKGGRRYDTAFFLCCLAHAAPEHPHGAHEPDGDGEVTACQWSSPSEAFELFKSQDIWIAPPQFYELCRLGNFSTLHDLHTFGSERALEGCERWMPVVLVASDGQIHILPGDELYPEDPDLTGERKPVLTSNKKIEELMKGVKKLHRMVLRDPRNISVHVNIQQKYKHINPRLLDSKNGNGADCNSKL